jgi:PEP-CTERM motif
MSVRLSTSAVPSINKEIACRTVKRGRARWTAAVLMGLAFGKRWQRGLTTSLYITAGPDHETGGLFARIDAVPEPSTVVLGGASFALLVSRRRKSFVKAAR